MKTLILGAAASALFVGAALAQTVTQYYVVHDTKAKKCTVMNVKPTDTTMAVVNEDAGNMTVYKTQTEAEAAMKRIKVCM